MLFQKVLLSIIFHLGEKMRRIKGGKQTSKQKLEQEHRQYNKEMRQLHCHHMQKTYDDFLAYKYGYSRVKNRKLPSEEKPYIRPEQKIPSLNSGFVPIVNTEKREYTGSLVTGVATMHKSNAVPVINSNQAKDLASMRR